MNVLEFITVLLLIGIAYVGYKLFILENGKDDKDDNIEKCLILLDKINEIKKGKKEVEMILLDPMGHSQILHKDAKSRDLDEVEIAELPTGPSIPVLNLNED